MKRRIFSILIYAIIGIVVTYLLYFFTYSIISDKKLEVVSSGLKYSLSNALDVSSNRITGESEVYKQGKIIEYDCVVDSSYCISMIKVGMVENETIFENIKFVQNDIPSRQSLFNFDITSPYPIGNIPFDYVPWYNVSLLPINNIHEIDVFIEGECPKKMIIDDILFFPVRANNIYFSFNNMNKADLFFQYSGMNRPNISTVFFFIDNERFLFIGHIYAFSDDFETLNQIMKIED
ncbi:hypothetical protein LJB75_00140 [Bacteroidales bacterium OttesenSCG-928-L19]|nr:hypothetical protein [Bacteroidales bacterium OttesenSCG-928-L19]